MFCNNNHKIVLILFTAIMNRDGGIIKSYYNRHTHTSKITISNV